MKLIIFILLFPFYSFSQNEYDCLITKAEINLNKKDTLEALSNYLQVLSFKESTPFDYLNAILCASSLQHDSLTYHLLCQGTLRGLTTDKIKEINLTNFKTTPYWENYLHKKDSIYLIYSNQLDREWVDAINNMKYIDQKIRNSYLNLSKDSLKNSELQKLFMKTIDSLNFINLLDLTRKKGFPTRNTVGYYNFNYVWLILWHHRGLEYYNNTLWIQIKPYINDAIKKGEIPLDFLTGFEDFYNFEMNQPICYGTLFSYYRYFPEYNKIRVFEVDKLDERRKEKGLCPIKLHLESLSLPMPEGLKINN